MARAMPTWGRLDTPRAVRVDLGVGDRRLVMRRAEVERRGDGIRIDIRRDGLYE